MSWSPELTMSFFGPAKCPFFKLPKGVLGSDILFPYRSPSPQPHPDPTQHPETDPKRSQNRPETDPKRTRNGPETALAGGGFVGTGRGGGCKGKRKSRVLGGAEGQIFCFGAELPHQDCVKNFLSVGRVWASEAARKGEKDVALETYLPSRHPCPQQQCSHMVS